LDWLVTERHSRNIVDYYPIKLGATVMQALFFILLALAGQTTDQQQVEYDKDEALIGLGQFRVLVEDLKPESPVTKAQLQTDTELRLRSLGIELSPKNIPYLYINVNIIAYKIGDTIALYFFNVKVSYNDLATLRSGKLVPVRIWDTSIVGYASPNVAEKTIRKTVKDQVDLFANAWLKTHPKEPEKKSDTPKP